MKTQSKSASKQRARRKRDYSKYKFKNSVYNKRTLVLSVIKDYVLNHPGATSKELKDVFPSVLKEVRQAPEKKYFTSKDNVIVTSDKKKLAVNNQWTKLGLDKFLDRVKGFGYKIRTI